MITKVFITKTLQRYLTGVVALSFVVMVGCQKKEAPVAPPPASVEQAPVQMQVEAPKLVKPISSAPRQKLFDSCMKNRAEDQKRYCECYSDEVSKRLEKKGKKTLEALPPLEKAQLAGEAVMSCKHYSDKK